MGGQVMELNVINNLSRIVKPVSESGEVQKNKNQEQFLGCGFEQMLQNARNQLKKESEEKQESPDSEKIADTTQQSILVSSVSYIVP
jgi:flagellar hook-basal body complex protein FliE